MTSERAMVIGKDVTWRDVEQQMFKILEFTPLADVVDGKVKSFSIKHPCTQH